MIAVKTRLTETIGSSRRYYNKAGVGTGTVDMNKRTYSNVADRVCLVRFSECDRNTSSSSKLSFTAPAIATFLHRRVEDMVRSRGDTNMP